MAAGSFMFIFLCTAAVIVCVDLSIVSWKFCRGKRADRHGDRLIIYMLIGMDLLLVIFPILYYLMFIHLEKL